MSKKTLRASRKARKQHLRNIRRQQKRLRYESAQEQMIKKTLAFIEKEKMFDIFSGFKIGDDKRHEK